MRRSDSTFGLSLDEWNEAKAELRSAILGFAWQRQMTYYSQVAPKVTVIQLNPHSELMNHLLGAILEDENAEHRPLLTAIVTHKDGDKEPGPGFYEMAKKLGYRFDEPYVFWSTQVTGVFKAHGRPDRPF